MHLDFLTDLFAGKIIQAFCWMLIHSLWQGLVFTVISGVVMMLTTRSGAGLRYNIVAVLFFLFIAICGFTFIRELNIYHSSTVIESANSVDINEKGLPYLLKRFVDFASSHASLIDMCWFIIFCFKGVKMIFAFAYQHYIKKQRTPIVDGFWRNRILNLCKQLKIKKTVLLFESEIVKIPVVMWHLKPIIFIPVGLLINLTAGEVEAVLLHELAHIRRNDYLVNIIQVIAESIFFFNPALLWMSNLLREEREHCCDDIAVAHTKSKKRFIQALISFKESSSSNNSIAMAFPGSKNQLLRRVSRIIYNRNSTLDGVGKSFVLGSLVLLALLTTAATNSNKIFQGIKTVKKEVPFIKPKPAEQAVLEQAKIPVAIIKSKVVNKRIPRRQNIVIAHDNLEINRPETNLKSAVSKAYDQVVTEDKEMAIASGEGQIAELAKNERSYRQAEVYKQQAELYRQQAEKDREQAAKDRKQAELDKMQADKDRERAVEDMKQAELDRQQAEKDRQQAEQERLVQQERKVSD